MGEAYGMYVGEKHTGFWWGNLKKENHLEDQYVDGRITLKLISDKYNGGVNWIDLAQDKEN
jgi:hypothetical protein